MKVNKQFTVNKRNFDTLEEAKQYATLELKGSESYYREFDIWEKVGMIHSIREEEEDFENPEFTFTPAA